MREKLKLSRICFTIILVTVYFSSAITNNEMIIFYINSVMFHRPERAI
jgi:hypothetical protein